MNDGVFASPPPQPPHINQLFGGKMSLQQNLPPTSSSRKRKADDDFDTRMSASPSSSPSLSSAPLPRPIKKTRAAGAAAPAGRPLSLPRLLETLDANSLRSLLHSAAEAHPQLAGDLQRLAPRPGVPEALEVLGRYQQELHDAFPFGNDQASDYAFNRVRGHIQALLDALADFTRNFLPPQEPAPQTSLSFLDDATTLIHRLPDWRTFQNNVPKHNAYDEIARAWVVTIQEAAKRAAGISLRYDGWDKRLAKHNQLSGGRLQPAVDEMHAVLGWSTTTPPGGAATAHRDEAVSVREQLLSGTYGSSVPVRVGPW